MPIIFAPRRIPKADTSYKPPPAAFDNGIDKQVMNPSGMLSSGGFSLTLKTSGEAVVGSGSTDAVPKFTGANTIGDSILRTSGANVLTLLASAIATLTVPFTGTAHVGKQAVLTPSASIAMDWSAGTQFTLTPDQSCTITPSNGFTTQKATLIITTSGASAFTITFAANFLPSGTLSTGTTSGKTFVLEFEYNGAKYIEVRRTTAL